MSKASEKNGEAATFRSYLDPLQSCHNPLKFTETFKTLFVRPGLDLTNAFLTWSSDLPQEKDVSTTNGYIVEKYKPNPTGGGGRLLPRIGKEIEVYGVCTTFKTCFKVFRVESGSKRYWIFGDIPTNRMADLPVFVQSTKGPWNFSSSRVINLREALAEWLDDHPPTTVDIYRTGGSGEKFLDLYRKGNPAADFTDIFSPGIQIVHIAHNVRYAEGGEGAKVNLQTMGLIKVALPATRFREMLTKNQLEIHVLRNSTVTHPVSGGIYVDEASVEL